MADASALQAVRGFVSLKRWRLGNALVRHSDRLLRPVYRIVGAGRVVREGGRELSHDVGCPTPMRRRGLTFTSQDRQRLQKGRYGESGVSAADEEAEHALVLAARVVDRRELLERVGEIESIRL